MAFIVIFKDPDSLNIDGPVATNNKSSARLIHLIDQAKMLGGGTNNGDQTIRWHVDGIFNI